MKRAVTVIVVLICSWFYSYSQKIYWNPTNGPYGGAIQALAMNSNGYLFAGGSSIFRAGTNGDNWEVVLSDLESTPVGHIVTDLKGNILVTAGSSFYHSSDDGITWIKKSKGLPNAGIGSVLITPDGSFYAGFLLGGLYRFNHKANIWEQSITGFEGKDWLGREGLSISSLFVSRTGELLAGFSFPMTNYQERGVYKHTESNNKWNRLGTAKFNGNIIKIISDSHGHIFAGTSMGSIYRWEETTNEWNLIPVNFPLLGAMVADYFGHIFVGITNGGIFRSSDDGKNWEKKTTGLNKGYIFSLLLNPVNHIFAATESGVFRSRDLGNNWSPVNVGISNLLGYNILVYKTGKVLVATAGGGIFSSDDDGTSWYPLNNGISEFGQYSLAYDSHDNLFAGASIYGLFMSSNQGKTWKQISDIPVGPYRFDKLFVTSRDILFATDDAGGLFKSTNQGERWITINDSLPKEIGPIMSLAENSIGDIFAGRWGRLYKSSDNGENWNKVLEIDKYLPFDAIAFNKDSIGCAVTYEEIFRTTDLGFTWKSIGKRPVGHPARSLFFSNKSDVYMVAPTLGVYYSSDNGLTWQTVNGGLGKDKIVYSIAQSPNGNLFVGTVRGVYRNSVSLTSVQNNATIPSVSFINQNYPNPFNPRTTIEFHISSHQFVSLKIFDLLGREIATLLNEHKNPGAYKVIWDAPNAPSGIYLYKLKAGEFVETKKMLLVK